jgi:hypothetical protein
MAYKIAVGSSDGQNIDLKFGEVSEFRIYEVDGTHYQLLGFRSADVAEKDHPVTDACHQGSTGCQSGGCSGSGHGCSGPADVIERVELIADCRCIVCKKIGFQAQKQLEKKAISVFDVECPLTEALDKITSYYSRLNHWGR